MTKARTLADNFAADINGITAGTGITGGGTSGTVTITNEMATTITAKGDLLAGTGNAAFDNLAAGASGETLVADSSATTGLRWQGDYAAGKNKILNGDFNINQRAFSSTTSSAVFLFDRWKSASSGGTTTWSAQTFTPGAAPVAGYEGKNYFRIVTTSQANASDYAGINERIEGVRTLAGETATVSFWARANSGTPKIGTTFLQVFGSGGSPSSVVVVNGQSATISTSWARYSFTFSVPSISGKTIGTANDDSLQFEIFVSAGSDFATRSGTVGIQNNTFEIWGVQVEQGSVATGFQTATGTLAGELAACQRYYQKSFNQATALGTATSVGSVGMAAVATTANANIIPVRFPVVMRGTPTITLYSPGTGATGKIQNVSSASDVNATDLGTGESGFAIYVTGAPGGAVGYWLAGQYQAVIEL